MVDNYGLILL